MTFDARVRELRVRCEFGAGCSRVVRELSRRVASSQSCRNLERGELERELERELARVRELERELERELARVRELGAGSARAGSARVEFAS